MFLREIPNETFDRFRSNLWKTFDGKQSMENIREGIAKRNITPYLLSILKSWGLNYIFYQ